MNKVLFLFDVDGMEGWCVRTTFLSSERYIMNFGWRKRV